MPRYASKTKVPVTRSRGEIDALLRDWGADSIRWTDHYNDEHFVLEFLWHHEGASYLARIDTKAEGGAQVEHRILLLWLKGCFNAICEGLIRAEEVFLPFLVGQDGLTVAQVALPRLRTMLTAGAREMLQLPDGD